MTHEKKELTDILRKILLKLDMLFHVIAAVLLLIACTFIFYYAVLNILSPTRDSIIHLVNDVLLALIILELLWTVIRWLKKQKFILGPFFAIGIIAALRRILLVEAQTSYLEHVPYEKLYEIGLSAVIIIILMIAYYISIKADKLEQQD
ncbi:MAG TPA: phosphate-starvation-inducible PsiE family protein [Thermodesulfovibrionales bacterium]|nr:phosphate-starvation-inducible PsiE family protein [Thermodesulfovibrionales bacterium]